MECERPPGTAPPPPSTGPAAGLGDHILKDWGDMVARLGVPLPAVNPQAQVQWANGSAYTTSRELEGVPAMPVQGYTHLIATRSGRLLVMSYNATVQASKRGRPHLTVYLQDGGPLAGDWSMIAQANFLYPKLLSTDPQCAHRSGNSAGAEGALRRGGGRLVAWLSAAAAVVAALT